MTKQQLISKIGDYIEKIAARILALLPDAKNDFWPAATALKDKFIKDNDPQNPHIKFFAAIKLLQHIDNNKPLNFEEKNEELLNAAINEKGSRLKQLYLDYDEYLKSLSKPANNVAANADPKPDIKANPNDNCEKENLLSIKKVILSVIAKLILNNKFVTQIYSNLNRLVELFGVDFLVELQQITAIDPMLLADNFKNQNPGFVNWTPEHRRIVARNYPNEQVEKAMRDFFNHENYALALWDRIQDIKTLQRLLPEMNILYIHDNLAKILKLAKTKDDFFTIYDLLIPYFPYGINWPLEFTERCFDPNSLNITLQNFSAPDTVLAPKHLRPVDAQNLINSPRAALSAATHLINTLDDFERLASEYPVMMVNILNDPSAAITLFNKLFVNNIDIIIEYINLFTSWISTPSISPEKIIFAMLGHAEIFTAVLNKITREQISRIQFFPKQYKYFQFIFDQLQTKISSAEKLLATANNVQSSPRPMQIDDSELTIDYFKEEKNAWDYARLISNDKNRAERWFKRFFEDNMTEFVNILINPKTAAPLLAMLKHPTVLAMAVSAIDTNNIYKLFCHDDLADSYLTQTLLADPAKMLGFVQLSFTNAEIFIAFINWQLTGNRSGVIKNIRKILNHEKVIAYVAGLFTTTQQLLAFKAVKLEHIHPVYYIAEWLLRHRQQVSADTSNIQELAEFLEKFHGYNGILKFDDRVTNELSGHAVLPPLIIFTGSFLFGDSKQLDPLPTVVLSSSTGTAAAGTDSQSATTRGGSAGSAAVLGFDMTPRTAAGIVIPAVSGGIAGSAMPSVSHVDTKHTQNTTPLPTAKL